MLWAPFRSFFTCGVLVGLIVTMALPAVAQEYSAPVSSPKGEFFQNADFQTWNDGKPLNWFRNSLGLRPGDQTDPKAKAIITPQGKGGYLYQHFNATPFRVGDVLNFEVEAKCSEPNVFSAVIWVVYTGKPPQKQEFTVTHPGDGQWHTLQVTANIGKAPLERVDFLVGITAEAKGDIWIEHMQATVVPEP